ncbi:MAG: copper chaperone PCu(A)C [Melioribacteraceae bacterium]
MKKTILYILVVANVIIISSCQYETDENKNSITSKTNKQIEVSNAWMTPAAKNRNSAAYFTITNNSNVSDTLFEVFSTLSQLTELHETYKRTEGMLGMRSVDYIVVPSKEKFEFSPGGFHVMLIGLIKNLPIESSGEITLKFKVAGSLTISVDCRLSQK